MTNELKIKISADLSELKKGLTEAESVTGRLASNVGQSTKVVTDAMGTITTSTKEASASFVALEEAPKGLGESTAAASREASQSMGQVGASAKAAEQAIDSLSNAPKAIGENTKLSAEQASASLASVDANAKGIEQTFQLLSKAPFSFGVSAEAAAQTTKQSLAEVSSATQGTEQSFVALSKAPYAFGANAGKALSDAKNEAISASVAIDKLADDVGASGARTSEALSNISNAAKLADGSLQSVGDSAASIGDKSHESASKISQDTDRIGASAKNASDAIEGISGSSNVAESALNKVSAASVSLGNSGKEASGSVVQGLSSIDSAAKSTEQSFTILSKAPFTFGEKASKAIGQARAAITDASSSMDRLATSADKSGAKASRSLAEISEAADKAGGSIGLSKAEIDAWDAAARRNSSEQFEAGLRKLGTRADASTGKLRVLNREMKLIDERAAKFSFGVGANPQLLPKVTKDVNNLTKGVKGANTVAMEFSRIIQDAPFGIIGIGNNITQLTQNFANLRAQTGSTSQAMKIAFSSLLSGTNLLVLGISAVTTALTVYTMWARRSKNETEEAKDAQQEYTDALRKFVDAQDAVSRTRVKGAQDSSREVATLRALYAVATDATTAIDKRKQAVDSLQKEYPAYFGNLNDELILTGQAESAYRRLTSEILASGKARAAIKLQADAYDELAAIDLRREKRQGQQLKLQEAIAKVQKEIKDGLGVSVDFARDQSVLSAQVVDQEAQYAVQLQRGIDLQEKLSKLNEERTADGLREVSLYRDIDLLQKNIVANVQAGGKIIDDTTKKTSNNAKEIADYASQIANIFGKSEGPTNMIGLTGLDLDIEKVRQRYEKMYTDLNAVEQKLRKDQKLSHDERMRLLEEASRARAQLGINEADEIAAAIISNEQKTQAAIEAIYAKAGISRISSLQQDLQRIQAYYDEQRRIHKDNIEILNALDEAHRQEAINARRKWQADLITIDVDTTRRTNELRSQLMIRQLNNEVKLWKRAAEDRLKAMVDAGIEETKMRKQQAEEQARIQERYWRRMMEIQQFQRLEDMAQSFADVMGNAFEDSLMRGENFFKALQNEFKRMLVRMAADAVRAQIGRAIMSGMSSSSNGDNSNLFSGLIKGLAGMFSSSGQAGQWSNNFTSTFASSGAAGRWTQIVSGIFSASGTGGGWLRSLTGIFSSMTSMSSGSGGGWFGKLLGGLFRGFTGYSSGNFPTGNYGGGNFPTTAPINSANNFIPNGASARSMNVNVNVQGVAKGNDLYLLGHRNARVNDRFNGGQ